MLYYYIWPSANNMIPAQSVDGGSRDTHLAQDFIGVLSEHRRRQPRAALLADKGHRVPNAIEPTGRAVLVLHDQVVFPGMGMREQLGDRIDRRTGNADLVQYGIPMCDTLRRDCRLHMCECFRA